MEYSYSYKKHLGQHFLSNKNILGAMLRAGEITKKDTVLEVGPGLGTLTELLAEKAKKVIAIEKDRELIPKLQEKFKKNQNVQVVRGDILKFYSGKKYSDRPQYSGRYKIIANLPYYITARFLRLFLSDKKLRPKLMVLMIQKEVAQRIAAKNGKESLLSLSVKLYGKPEIVRYVPRGAFSPPPEVDSAIIKISDISDLWFKKNKINEKRFFEILRTAFQQKRKTLAHSLKLYSGHSDEKTFGSLNDLGRLRPEDLSLSNWIEIYLVVR